MGANRAQIVSCQKLGFAAWLKQQFFIPVQNSHYAWIASRRDPETGKPFTHIDFKFNQDGFDASAWRKLLYAPDTLRQRIVLALSEIVVVSIDGLDAY